MKFLIFVKPNVDGDNGMVDGLCSKRGESAALDTGTVSLVVMNHFPDNPNYVEACKYNSDSLIKMINTCQQASRQRWPNYISVDFYKVKKFQKKDYHIIVPKMSVTSYKSSYHLICCIFVCQRSDGGGAPAAVDFANSHLAQGMKFHLEKSCL